MVNFGWKLGARIAAVTIALVAPLVITSSASASPATTETTSSSVSAVATLAAPPAGLPCVSTAGAKACYEDAADRWWVYDSLRDFASADARWEVYLNGNYVRGGICRNSHGVGTWGYCTESYGEDRRVVWQARVYDDSENVLIRTSGWRWANA